VMSAGYDEIIRKLFEIIWKYEKLTLKQRLILALGDMLSDNAVFYKKAWLV